MGVTRGYYKEDEMIHFLNNKKVKDLQPSLKELVRFNYGIIEPEETVLCEYGKEHTKCDFVISYQGKKKGVQLKTGKAEVVHCEKVNTFIPFLRSIGVSEETLRTLLLYQFGDGTLDGTGSRRHSTNEVLIWLKDRIKKANKELNSDKELMKKFVDRVMFQGVDLEAMPANCIFIGDIEYGVVATKKQIFKYIDRRGWDYYEWPHIGPILFRPDARYVDVEIKKPESRQRVQCFWPHLATDIRYIQDNIDFYTPMRHRTYDE